MLSGCLSKESTGLIAVDDLLSKEEPEGAEYNRRRSQPLDNMAELSLRMFSCSSRVDAHPIHGDAFLGFC